MATSWRVAHSITRLFQQLQAAAPLAAPRPLGNVAAEEWGTIGDAVHDPSSDHSPHNFPGWGNQIVTAGDFPNRAGYGLDAHAVLDSIRRSHDARVKYGISNDQIFSSYATSSRAAWTWGPYNPNDPNRDRHLTHGHLSVVGDARADGTQDWQTGLGLADVEDEDMGGASFGPTPINVEGTTSLCIPPVQGGLADPRQVWLNLGADTGPDKARLRVWWTKGDGAWSPFGQGGEALLSNGVVWSAELPAGLRLLSITRLPVVDGGTPFAGSISACFERK
jgi:hypothetical protein